MIQLVIASKPLLQITLESYLRQYDALNEDMRKTCNKAQLVEMTERRTLLFTLISQTKEVLKELED